MASPKLRFKEFSGDLVKSDFTKAMVQIIDGDRGNNYPKSDDFHDEEFCLFLNAGNVTKYGFSFENTQFITKEKDSLLRKGKLKRNDLVITTRGTVGNVAYFDKSIPFENMRINSGMVLARCKDNVIADYINQFLKSDLFEKWLNKNAFGSAQPQLTVKLLNSIEVNYPPKEEQSKIASFLSAVDEKISQLTQKHELLSQYKQGMMQKLFSQQIRFKADDGRDFGEWEEKKLSDIALLTSSKRVHLSDYVAEGIPFFRGKEISELKSGVFPSDILYISREQFNNIKNKFDAPKNGEILITAVGTIANTYLINTNYDFYFKDGNLIWLKEIKANPKFLMIMLDAFKKDVVGSAIGSTQKALTITNLNKLIIKVPCIEEQTKIANFLTAIDQKIEVVAQQIAQTKQWKKGLLQQMFV
ncbi:restriction endonuclease subunit S [Acinetobacter sp. YH12142]|uniref:restriction endonuclease subunit S n=1 Tax=Acinetobacter sp. YH12142 TaxID=2601126 RepID=UPI0015D19856|nr:restriction endonuclease subunit S [Acinetobacter sp. YH12142]